MGGKDSKLNFIPYEDAVKRVTAVELKRLKDTFKRTSTLNGYMNETTFRQEVLWDGISTKLAKVIYHGFGGNQKGLQFRDLLCGLVVLTQGRQEEKIRLLYGMYANDSYSCVHKHEMDRRILDTEGAISTSLSTLFKEADEVDYETFKYWIICHPTATIMSHWLLTGPCTLSLSSDTLTPTFYQTLAGVTHLEENEITALEKRYWTLKGASVTGRFDYNTFRPLISPPIPDSLTQGLFEAFDENVDSHIDFKEMACGISACCKGPVAERQKFCFKVFDKNNDEKLDKAELCDMIEALLSICKTSTTLPPSDKDMYSQLVPESVVTEVIQSYGSENQEHITLPEYLVWTVNNSLTEQFSILLSQVCHIILGLRPQSREEEGKIVNAWLASEWKKPLQCGQTWYLVASQWWTMWKDYVSNKPTITCISPTRIANSNLTPVACTNGGISLTRITPLVNGSVEAPSPQHINHSPTSVISLSSSSSSSQRQRPSYVTTTPPRPAAVDNSTLIVNPNNKCTSITNEGGKLRRDITLVRGRDFELLPGAVWLALSSWYGGSPALPRNVIAGRGGGECELELYPVTVKILKHQTPINRSPPANGFSGFVTTITSLAFTTVKRPQIATAAFSKQHTIYQVQEFLCSWLRYPREDVRLWKFRDELNMTLLEDDELTVEEAGIEENHQILMEIRNKDLTWPEELCQLAKNKHLYKKDQTPTTMGVTGLNNLGNTCFMNAALQCVSNVWPLTYYFKSGMYLYEINRNNPLGMRGHVALRYGDLVKDLWSGSSKTIVPLRLRWTIGKYAPRFNGFQQHDTQEFLSFLLDGLHEDLNRVHNKPYVELKDSEGRPDDEVAKEARDNHLLRNQSIIVDLFHGQLKSEVCCKTCGHPSTRFDAFTYLSLPLPMDSCVHIEVIVVRSDGSIPTCYGIRLNMDDKYWALKKEVSVLCGIPEDQLLLVDVLGPVIKSLPQDRQKIHRTCGGVLYAYQIPQHPPIQPMTALEERTPSVPSINQDLPVGDITVYSTRDVDFPTDVDDQPLKDVIPLALDCLAVEASDCEGPDTNPPSPPSQDHNKSMSQLINGFVIGVHRKMIHMELYFLAEQKSRPNLFGIPLIVPCGGDTTSRQLYEYVWIQVARLVSPTPRAESKTSNHAQDCDDSLAYEYPFLLKTVQRDGIACAKCPWYCFCRGCKLECTDEPFNFRSQVIAIDWEATALHLRYQTSNERQYDLHKSVDECRQQQTEPIDLDTCLRAFTTAEELGKDEMYYCSKCKKHCLAIKKLDIWMLPPILIVNLKRFQYMNCHWVKSHKIVKFPFESFDPSQYLAKRPTHLTDINRNSGDGVCNETLSCSEPDPLSHDATIDDTNDDTKPLCQSPHSTYSLCALSCHSGILGGGHYITYARNPNGHWYLYNDSMCKEVSATSIDTSQAYILFYIRDDTDFTQFYPNISGKTVHTEEPNDEYETDIKKCVIQ